jgi:hypothetical protein
MLNYYFDLIDDTKLPPKAKFLDPYDHTIFTPREDEDLTSLIQRANDYRIEARLPLIPDTELRQLVVTSLYESTASQIQKDYFESRTVHPTLAQMASAAKTIAQEVLHSNNVTAKRREARASKCLDNCAFHKTSSKWSTSATNLIARVAGLSNVHTSPAEKALGTCTMCGGCALQPKVRFNLIAVLATLTPEKLDNLIRAYKSKAFDKCWIVNEALTTGPTRELLERKLKNGKADGMTSLKVYLSNKISQAKAPHV